jgi:Holliday junction DNA helicase RuvA
VIGFLRGTLIQKEPPLLVVDVQGVGYEVEAPLSTCFGLPDVGQPVQLRTHLVIREDQHTLFGFATEAERRLFRELLKVSGVGAKLALGVLSGISVDGFVRCIETEDTASLVRLPGIGRKTAERLVVEMRDRVNGARSVAGAGPGPVPVAGGDARNEALNALVALGYKPPEARRMLDRVPDEGQGTEELLRAVLRAAAPKTPGVGDGR